MGRNELVRKSRVHSSKPHFLRGVRRTVHPLKLRHLTIPPVDEPMFHKYQAHIYPITSPFIVLLMKGLFSDKVLIFGAEMYL